MNADVVYSELVRIVGNSFPEQDSTIPKEMMLADLPGWDSFRFVELILSVEEAFGIKMSSQDVDRLKLFGDLIGIVTSHVAPHRISESLS